MQIRVQSDRFDSGAEVNAFSRIQPDVGAIVTFTGIVRDTAARDLKVMEIEHYPGMTERAITNIVQEAMARWSLMDCLVIHRHGTLAPGEPIMMVATAAAHRADAFASADFLMDYLKSRAPFWKKEITAEAADWVAAKPDDEAALKRW
jgi:molybdopterin synthase catalytic subunit